MMSQPPMTPTGGALSGSQIEISRSDKYGAGWRILGNLFGLIPTIVLMGLFIPVMYISSEMQSPVLLVLSTPVFLGIYFLSLFLNGLFNCNPFLDGSYSPQYGFFGQITLNPRLFTGVMGAIEDADDFGYLRFEGGWVIFEGASVRLRVHYSDLAAAQTEAIGMRALLAGKALRFDLRAPAGGYGWFRFHAREGWTIIGQRRMSAALVNYARAAQLPGYMER